MNSLSKISKNSKTKLRKFFSIFLSLTLILSSAGLPATGDYSYASEVCDPEDEDYEECLAEEKREKEEEERERQEEEEERRRDEAEEKQEFEEQIYEDYVEENEDDPNWQPISKEEFLNQYYGITPTPEPSSSNEENPEAVAGNSQTGEESENEASSNSASEIDIENINSTTLEEEVNVVANTGNNTISGEDEADEAVTESQGLSEEQQGTTDGEGQEEDQEEDSPPEGGTEAQGEGFSESESSEEEELSYEAATGEEDDDFQTDASGEELTEGEDAEQLAISEDIDETTVHNENHLELENEIEVTSSSGENELSQNEDNAELQTGPGQSSATLENQGNINSTEVGGNEGAEAVNEETGDTSSNFTSDEVSETLAVENENYAAVENNLSVSSTSGENAMVDNEGDATLTTEEVEIIVNLLNILNLNITGQDFTHLIINIFGNLTGEFDLDDIAEDFLGIDEDEFLAMAMNSNTGDNSENTALAQNSETLDVENKNQAAVINNVEVEGTTGANELSENEGSATLLTGRIKILTSILNFINANFSGTDWYFAMINIFGSLEGDILLPDPEQFLLAQDGGAEAVNAETGDDSQNQALVSETEEISVTNDNTAEVKNTVDVTGDSGTNQALANEDETEMTTGEVNVTAQIMNWLNYNIFGNRWVMVVVNVFGRWLGRVIAFPGRGDIEAPESGTLVAVAGGEEDLGPAVVAENEGTGENSENFAQSSSETNWEVSNENKAYVENNVEVEGVSGQNQASENEDRVNIFTGWIDIGVNLFNIVNFNVTGRQWMLLIVNIFGDFLGNIVFPHQESEATSEVLAEADLSSEEVMAPIAESLNDSGGIGGLEGGDFSEENGDLGQDQSNENNAHDSVILAEGQSTDHHLNLIRKYPRTFVLAEEEINDNNLGDEEELDFSPENYYNQDPIDDEVAYSQLREAENRGTKNFIAIVRKTFEKLLFILKILITKIF